MRCPLRILVAEDDSSDRELLMRAFAKAGIDAAVQYVQDGQQVIDLLSRGEAYRDPVAHPLPTLLLLDLKMPRVDGFEVLEWLWQHPEFRGLVTVVVLSGSDDPSGIHRAYALGAKHYYVKPDDPKELVRVIRELDQNWDHLFAVEPSARDPAAEHMRPGMGHESKALCP